MSLPAKSPQNETGQSANLGDVLPLNTFVEQNPQLVTERRMRWLIFNRETNGLKESGALSKRAGRWYVIVPRFTEFLIQGAEA